MSENTETIQIIIDDSGVSSQVRNVTNEINKIGDSADDANKKLTSMGDKIEPPKNLREISKELELVSGAAGLSATEIRKLGQSMGMAGGSVARAGGGFSAAEKALQRVATSAKLSADQVEAMNRRMAATSAASTQAQALESLAKSANLSAREVEALGRQMGMSSKAIDEVGNAGRRAAGGVNVLGTAGKALVGYFGVTQIVGAAKSMTMLADEIQSVNARMLVAAGSAEAFNQVQAQTYALANKLGQGYGTLADFQSRLIMTSNKSAKALQGTAIVAEAVSHSLKISGASAAEASSVTLQLSQAFASGVLRGEEFNAMMEGAPRLAQALADGLGAPISALRDMAEEGELTRDRMVNALESQRAQLEQEVGKMKRTVGEAVRHAKNEWGRFADAVNQGGWGEFWSNVFDGWGEVFRRMADYASESKTAFEQLEEQLQRLEKQGIDTTGKTNAFQALQSESDSTRAEIERLERGLVHLENNNIDTSHVVAQIEKLREKLSATSDAASAAADHVRRLANEREVLLNAQRTQPAIDAPMTTQDLTGAKKALEDLGKAYEKTAEGAKKAKRAALEHNIEVAKRERLNEPAMLKAFQAELAALDKVGTERKRQASEQSRLLKKQESERKRVLQEALADAKKLADADAEAEKWHKARADERERKHKEVADERERKRKEVADAVQKEMEAQEKEAAKILDNIQTKTADVFYDMFQNVGDGWRNLWDSMKNWALRILSELVAQAAMQRIVVPVFLGVTGATTAEASVTQLTGGSGDLLSGATNLIGKIPGMGTVGGWLGSTIPGMEGAVIQPTAAESLLAPGVSPVQTPGVTWAQGIGGAAGIAGGVYQMTKGGTGNLVGGAGTAIGGAMMFNPATAPFAPFVMLGSQFLGSVFGDKKQHSPSVLVSDNLATWGSTNVLAHAKSGAGNEQIKAVQDQLNAYMSTQYKAVEDTLSQWGSKYTDLLKGQTFKFGRDTAGNTIDWDWGSDKDLEKVTSEAQEVLRKKILEAARSAFEAAGRDLATDDSATKALQLLSGQAADAFRELQDAIRAGAESGATEEYIAKLQAFQASIASITATWDSIKQASQDLVTPPSQYEMAVRNTNAQYDQWIAQLKELGFAQAKLTGLESDRAQVLKRLATEHNMDDEANARRDEISDRRDLIASRRAEAAEMQKQQEETEKLVVSLREQANAALKAGEGVKYVGLQMQIIQAGANPGQAPISWSRGDGSQKTASQFNYEWGVAHLPAIREAVESISAQALTLPNALEKMTAAQTVSMSELVNTAAYAQAKEYAQGNNALMRALLPALREVISQDYQTRFAPQGVGLSAIEYAWQNLNYVNKEFSAGGPWQRGKDVEAYLSSQGYLETALRKNQITTQEYKDALTLLKDQMSEAARVAGDLVAQSKRVEMAYLDLARAGEQSLTHYFGELSNLVAGFGKTVESLATPIGQAKEAIGKLESMSAVFSGSVNAILRGYGGASDEAMKQSQLYEDMSKTGHYSQLVQDEAKKYGLTEEAIARNMADNAQGQAQGYVAQYAQVYEQTAPARLIAEYAQRTADIITTQSAKQAAEALGKQDAFKDLLPTQLRDVSLLLDGIKQFDVEALYVSFARLSDALNKGTQPGGRANADGAINMDQFEAAYQYAIDVFQNGIPDAMREAGASMEEMQKRIADIMRASHDAAYPMTEYAAAVAQLKAQYSEWFFALTELQAGEEQLAQVRADEAVALENLAKENQKAIDGIILGMRLSVEPLTEYESAMRGIAEQANTALEALRQHDATEEERTQILELQTKAIEKLNAETKKTIDQILQQSGQITNPLDELAAQIQQTHAQFDGFTDRLVQLNATESELAQVEADRVTTIANLTKAHQDALEQERLATRLAEADQAVAQAQNDLRAAWAKEQSRLNEIIADHEQRMAAAKSSLLTAYSAERDRLDQIVADHERRVADARSELVAAYHRESSALTETAETFRRLSDQLREWRQSVLTGEDSPLSDAAKTSLAQAEWADVSRRAMLGDKDALAGMTDAGKTHLEMAKKTATSQEDYARIVGQTLAVTTQAESVAVRQASIAEQQLSALDGQMRALGVLDEEISSFASAVGKYNRAVMDQSAVQATQQLGTLKDQMQKLGLIDANVLTFAEAMDEWNAANADQSAQQAAEALERLDTQVEQLLNINTSVLSVETAVTNLGTALRAQAAAAQAQAAAAQAAAAQAQQAKEPVGRSTGLPKPVTAPSVSRSVQGYASGGYHFGGLRIVGERGPELEATGPARIWNATETRSMLRGDNRSNAELVAEIRQLREDLRAANGAIAQNTRDTAKLMRRWDGDGMPEVRVAI